MTLFTPTRQEREIRVNFLTVCRRRTTREIHSPFDTSLHIHGVATIPNSEPDISFG